MASGQTDQKNVVISNCTATWGHQLLAIDSELSGGVEIILKEDCSVEGELYHLCYIKTNERRGGYAKNIYMRNVTATKVRGDEYNDENAMGFTHAQGSTLS